MNRFLARLPDREHLGPWLRHAAAELVAFVRHVGHRFLEDGCLDSAGTLAYTTLLSIVPLFAVIFSVMTAFPVFEGFSASIQDWLFANLVPASGEVVQDYMQQFASRAAELTAAGLIGITVAAILMMGAIDKAMNRIWRGGKRRSAVQSFMVYWTVITVGPFLVAASLVLSSYLVALAEFTDLADVGSLQQGMLAVTPFVGVVLAFMFLYAAVPNRRVPLWHAVAGAVFAAVLFEGAKRGFAAFVTTVPTYEAIYGTLAALPIFLIWIYVCWVVVLLGAEFTKALSGYRQARAGSLSEPHLTLVLAVRLIGDFWRAQQEGRGLTRQEIMEREPDAGDAAIGEAIDALERTRVIRRMEEGGWVLARDPSSYTLLDLYRGYPFVLADVPSRLRQRDPWNRALSRVLGEAVAGAEGALDRPVRDLLEPPPGEATVHPRTDRAAGD
ncbi:virulence factor BrkB family protein [Aquisalimonas lutea]|uniref:virulence factor BrkB family protein n=1 Tax=Aquisalimonas lutea TaxID=1327750 RepID=UPI0025B3F02F|nr:virulence factor BrkB family protein [Aquisalimonas lutea]MDN3519229.1 virulence factor BrkB family protein [Aquisalimonas lutea]